MFAINAPWHKDRLSSPPLTTLASDVRNTSGRLWGNQLLSDFEAADGGDGGDGGGIDLALMYDRVNVVSPPDTPPPQPTTPAADDLAAFSAKELGKRLAPKTGRKRPASSSSSAAAAAAWSSLSALVPSVDRTGVAAIPPLTAMAEKPKRIRKRPPPKSRASAPATTTRRTTTSSTAAEEANYPAERVVFQHTASVNAVTDGFRAATELVASIVHKVTEEIAAENRAPLLVLPPPPSATRPPSRARGGPKLTDEAGFLFYPGSFTVLERLNQMMDTLAIIVGMLGAHGFVLPPVGNVGGVSRD